MNTLVQHKEMIKKIIMLHFFQIPKWTQRISIGICNEVYSVNLNDQEVIVRMSPENKFLMGSHDHIPQFKALGIKVPTILFEDYSKNQIPFCYQIQDKIIGEDLGNVIAKLDHSQLINLSTEVVSLFQKVKTIPANNQFGLIWGGGENDLSDTWTERMKIWIEESKERGTKTGVMDNELAQFADQLFKKYKNYFDSVKPVTYYGDICSKNVMILNGSFNGLVDLDGLTQGDPLEAVGRIKLSWYGTLYGEIYTNAIMEKMHLNCHEKEIVTVYALLNQISWACENGIQFNQNTNSIVNREKEKADKKTLYLLAEELK